MCVSFSFSLFSECGFKGGPYDNDPTISFIVHIRHHSINTPQPMCHTHKWFADVLKQRFPPSFGIANRAQVRDQGK